MIQGDHSFEEAFEDSDDLELGRMDLADLEFDLLTTEEFRRLAKEVVDDDAITELMLEVLLFSFFFL